MTDPRLIEGAAWALWSDDAKKSPTVNVRVAWPRVADEYRRRATLALTAGARDVWVPGRAGSEAAAAQLDLESAAPASEPASPSESVSMVASGVDA
jgi:hypothetical protein